MANEIIRIEHLSKVFNGAAGRIVALDDINLSIHEGDIFGIIGLSGAGKSTLVRCMNLLETPTEGKVIFDGRNPAGHRYDLPGFQSHGSAQRY